MRISHTNLQPVYISKEIGILSKSVILLKNTSATMKHADGSKKVFAPNYYLFNTYLKVEIPTN